MPGPEYAAERLGYLREAMANLPDSVTSAFAGVGNPLSMGQPQRGQTVLDIGAGSGLAAGRTSTSRGRHTLNT